MMNCAIIGLGNLGFRHLEALLNFQDPLNIQLVDVSSDVLNHIKNKLADVNIHQHQISYHGKIDELQDSLLFVVVATNSKPRLEICDQLLSVKKVNFLLLEKFLFPKLSDYARADEIFSKTKTKAWVNCPRRMYPYYQKIYDELNPDSPIIMTVSAARLMVGTHAIHFLDLFSFFTKDQEVDSIDTEGLAEEIIESKRVGYIEFKGNLSIRSGNHRFVFQGFDNSTQPLEVAITQSDRRYRVLEHNGIVQQSLAINDWKWETFDFFKPMQSELTNKVLAELVQTGDCHLTKYEDSRGYHKAILNSLMNFIFRLTGKQASMCNIT